MLLSKQINDFFQINVYYIVDVHINSQRGEPLLCREYYLVLATENRGGELHPSHRPSLRA